MPLHLLSDRVAVIPEEPVEKEGSLLIPDQHRRSEQIGKVYAVGQGRMNAAGDMLLPMQVKEGDRVMYGWGSHETVVDGIRMLIFKESDIVAVID